MRKAHRRRSLWVMLIAGIIVLAFGLNATAQEDGTMDHSQFPQLQGPFETGPEVTQTCLQCHSSVGQDILGTVHWTWEYDSEVTGETYGKRTVINNYCVSMAPNEPRCTSCHIGYGWTDDSFDFTAAENIDCLICHDTTGTYKKFPTAAGHPVYGETLEFGGKEWPAPDLAAVAQNIGAPGRTNCGTCHFTGGGGDAVKHGDIDTSLANPDHALDVHMDAEGLDFACQTCHVTEGHDIAGSRYVMDAYADGAAQCTTCHGDAPHGNEMIDDHTAVIACQTCHIPEYARAQPTKMTWDWTTAGTPKEDGTHPLIIVDPETGKTTYDSRKGEFTWASNVVPEYRWSNGAFDFALIEEGVDPEAGFVINEALGSRGDGLIWPFKVFTGVQPYDAGTNTIAPLNLFPKNEEDGATAFWKTWDLEAAVAGGLAAWGQEYSGEMGQIESEMIWPITHMVAPADQALSCDDCHSDDGRLDYVALGYDESEAAGLAQFPPALTVPEPTTTTAAPPTTAAATTTTEPPTTTTEAAVDITVAATAPVEDDGGSVIPVILIIGGLVLVAAAGGYAFGSRRRIT